MHSLTRPTSLLSHGFLTAVVSILSFSSSNAWAQGTSQDYERSGSYDARTQNRVFRDVVEANWFGDDDDARFWYRIRTGKQSHEFVLVDANTSMRRPALDHRD